MDDALSSPTGLILDLRERMVRIETKLDSHNDAHAYIDRRFDGIDKVLLGHKTLVEANSAAIAASSTRVKLLAGIGTVALGIIPFLADHFPVLRP